MTTDTTATNPNQALWEKGDFTRLAVSMRESGEALAKSLGITKGLRVLDLGCGDGTTALPEAVLGANVLGVDIGRVLVLIVFIKGRGESVFPLRYRGKVIRGHRRACLARAARLAMSPGRPPVGFYRPHPGMAAAGVSQPPVPAPLRE